MSDEFDDKVESLKKQYPRLAKLIDHEARSYRENSYPTQEALMELETFVKRRSRGRKPPPGKYRGRKSGRGGYRPL